MSSPAGIIILLAGTMFVGLAPWRWAPGLGAFLGLFVTVVFLIGPTGISNLSGQAGTNVVFAVAVQFGSGGPEVDAAIVELAGAIAGG